MDHPKQESDKEMYLIDDPTGEIKMAELYSQSTPNRTQLKAGEVLLSTEIASVLQVSQYYDHYRWLQHIQVPHLPDSQPN